MGTNIDPCDLDPDVPMELWGPGYVGLSDASGPWVGGQEGETQARPLFCCLCCSARSFLPSGSTLGHVSSKRDLDEGGRRVRREEGRMADCLLYASFWTRCWTARPRVTP